MRLSSVVGSKYNNFNIARIILAFAVLYDHSYTLSLGKGSVSRFGFSGLAVDIFFFISGFLVTRSIFNGTTPIKFIINRLIRIYPALIVNVFLTTFTLAFIASDQPISYFISSTETKAFLWNNSTLLWGVTYSLPGVFESNPYPRAVNGSLWTMPFEVKMYAGLITSWIILSIFRKNRPKVFSFLLFIYVTYTLSAHYNNLYISGTKDHFIRLSLMFSLGAIFYVSKNIIILTTRGAFIVLALAIIGTAMTDYDSIIMTIAFPYILIFLVYNQNMVAHWYHRIGDCSYGFYIYAFPIQQCLAKFIPGITPLKMVGLSSVITLSFALCSWVFIERYSLRLKGDLFDYFTYKIQKI